MTRSESDDIEQSLERRFPRRFLLSAGAAVAALGVTEAMAPAASAAPGKTAWALGGNTGVASNGTNFLGTRNVAPLIFKTTASKTPIERMRITPSGAVGINAAAPAAMLEVRSSSGVTVRSVSTSAAPAAAAVTASAIKGSGLRAASADGTGVVALSTNGVALRATSTVGDGMAATGGPSAYGVKATGGYCGVSGTGSIGGLFQGNSSSGYGTYSVGGYLGVYGQGATAGLYGYGTTNGVYGRGATGVAGQGVTYGVSGSATDPNGAGVWGTGGQFGVHGNAARTAGVFGESAYVGVWGEGTSYGVFGLATDAGTAQTYGVFGQASNAASFAIYAQGRMHVAGTLSKSAGSFKIDHPLDPERKWLSHSFVESPDMMNVYNGNVVLDHDGTATVQLPDYFAALNTDFRYQLTPIGAHAPVYVASKIADNAFTIGGGTAGLEVSWQVTGIRQDAYAKEHPIVVETAKSAEDRGTREFVPPGSRASSQTLHPVAPGRVKHAVAPVSPTVAPLRPTHGS